MKVRDERRSGGRGGRESSRGRKVKVREPMRVERCM